MRLVSVLVLACACSNASSPDLDAATPPIDTPMPDAAVDAPVAARILVINEVAAGETPDWFEVVNVSNAAVALDEFIYVDLGGDFAKAKAFPAITIGPGAYYVQDVDDAVSGFKLASDEELWIYRGADHALSDAVDWDEGAAPSGMSYARSPDRTGMFATGAPSKGVANP